MKIACICLFPVALAGVLAAPLSVQAQPFAETASSADALATRLIDLRHQRREVGEQRAAVERATAGIFQEKHEIAADELIPLVDGADDDLAPLVDAGDDLAPLVDTPAPDARLTELNRQWKDLRIQEQLLEQQILSVSEQAAATDEATTDDPVSRAHARTDGLIRERDAAQARREAATRRAMAELVDLDDDGLDEAWADLDDATERVQDIDADLNSHVAQMSAAVARSGGSRLPEAPTPPSDGEETGEPANDAVTDRLLKACLQEQEVQEKRMIQIGEKAARCLAESDDPDNCDRSHSRTVELAAETLTEIHVRCAALQGTAGHGSAHIGRRALP